jgi:hypothetical protein
MDPNMTLLEGQHFPSLAKIIKTNNLQYREGIGPLTHTPKGDNMETMAVISDKICEEPPQVSPDKSRRRGGSSCINARKEQGGTHANAKKHDLWSLEGRGNISVVSNKEKGQLPVLMDPGGVPQHRREGNKPIVDGESSLDQSKGACDAIPTMEEEEGERCNCDSRCAGIV